MEPQSVGRLLVTDGASGFPAVEDRKGGGQSVSGSNTLTQRMSGPKCSGVVAMDISKMKEGDVAGFCAFNGLSGVLAVVMENGKSSG